MIEHRLNLGVVHGPRVRIVRELVENVADRHPHLRKRLRLASPVLHELLVQVLRLVFVVAMWMTGFDAPSCSTIYLDRPMRNHTLMQTGNQRATRPAEMGRDGAAAVEAR